MTKKILLITSLLLTAGFILILLLNNNTYDQEKFGINWNNFRKEHNIPPLIDNWSYNNLNALLEYSNSDISSRGHIKKYINLSKSATGSERDVFKVNNYIIVSLYERNDKNRVLYKIDNPKNEIINIFQVEKEVIDSDEANKLLREVGVSFQFNQSWDNHLN